VTRTLIVGRGDRTSARYAAEDSRQVADERTIDYRTPPAPRPCSRVATRTTLVLTLLLPATFVSFVVRYRRQFSLFDPSDDAGTSGSIVWLLVLLALAVADLVVIAAWRRRIARSVLVFAVVLLGLLDMYAVWFIADMLGFQFP
jgi:hypothetical protein